MQVSFCRIIDANYGGTDSGLGTTDTNAQTLDAGLSVGALVSLVLVCGQFGLTAALSSAKCLGASEFELKQNIAPWWQLPFLTFDHGAQWAKYSNCFANWASINIRPMLTHWVCIRSWWCGLVWAQWMNDVHAHATGAHLQMYPWFILHYVLHHCPMPRSPTRRLLLSTCASVCVHVLFAVCLVHQLFTLSACVCLLRPTGTMTFKWTHNCPLWLCWLPIIEHIHTYTL